MQLLRGRSTAIQQLAVSPDGRYVLAGGSACHVWDLHDPKAKHRAVAIGDSGDWGHDTQFLATDALFLSTSSPRGWFRHDLGTSATTDLGRPPALPYTVVCAHPSGTRLKVHVRGHVIRRNEKPPFYVQLGDGPPRSPDASGPLLFTLFGFSPDGTHFLAESGFTGDPARRHHLYDDATGAVVATFERPPGGYRANACTWCFRPDGRQLVVVASRRLLRYDCATGGQPAVLVTLPKSAVRASPPLAAHPDGRLLAVVEDGRAVTFRDADTLEVVRRYDFAMPTVTCVAFTPDGTRCVIGNSRGKVLLFDVE